MAGSSPAMTTREIALPAWGHAHFPAESYLLAQPCLGIVPLKAAQPGGRCSQGGVKVPTGGKGDVAQARERLLLYGRRVSRFGAIPKPTVKVRMKENGRGSRIFAARRSVCPDSGPERGKP
jgi:hypothetical protein